MFDYDPKAGYVWTTLSIAHSVLPGVLSRWEFWMFFALHLVVFFAKRVGLMWSADDKPDPFFMEWSHIQILTAMTTFFEVFYTNTCYSRYMHLYMLMKSIMNTVCSYAFQARLYIRPTGKPYDRVACRWMCAALLMSLHELMHVRELSKEDWMQLLSIGVLKRDEVEFLRGLKNQQRIWVILNASADVARVGLLEARAPTNLSKEVTGLVLLFRKQCDQVRDTMHNPIPFGYFHLLCMMLTLNLFMWAWAMGVSSSLFAPVFYFFSALIFVGMLDLASQLSNPFGTDLVDFPVHQWVSNCLEIVTAILNFEHSGSADGWSHEVEEEVSNKTRLQLGTEEIGIFLGSAGALGLRDDEWWLNSTSPRSGAPATSTSASTSASNGHAGTGAAMGLGPVAMLARRAAALTSSIRHHGSPPPTREDPAQGHTGSPSGYAALSVAEDAPQQRLR